MSAIRSLRAQDIPASKALLDTIFRYSRGVYDQSVVTDFPMVFSSSNFHNCRVVELQNRILSHAAIWPREMTIHSRCFKVGVIVLVATDPQFRNAGHASMLMRDLQKTMVQENYDFGLLWTGVPGFYHQLGWETIVPRGWSVQLHAYDRMTARAVDCEIMEYQEQLHFNSLTALHDEEPVRMTRDPDCFRSLLNLPGMDVSVAVKNRLVMAYLVRGHAVNKSGLVEYGGHPHAIIRLVTESVKRHPLSAEGLRWQIFHSYPELLEWVRESKYLHYPMSDSKGTGTEMILVLRSDGLPQPIRKDLFVWGLDQA